MKLAVEVWFTIESISRSRVQVLGIRSWAKNAGRAALLLSSAVLGDIHDLVLEDKQIRSTLARQANHVPIVVLDPSLENLTIHQLDRDRLLLFPDCLQEGRFLKGFFRGRRAPALGIGICLWRTERHARIVHKARETSR